MKKTKLFDYMQKHQFEQVVYFYDHETGLKGITCIHNTTLGPALGGTRMWNYDCEEDALYDCLRLARGMTYKAAAANLNLGGGKTVIIGDATKQKTEKYFKALGRYVESLNGRYITAEDVNTNTQDMNFIHQETRFVVGLEGKSGNPSPYTALGAFHGIRACLEYKFGDDDISKYTYAVQGAGQTGYYLIKFLLEANAKKIYFSEINQNHIDRMKREHPEVEFVHHNDIYQLDVDVFCPCALGASLNETTIPMIKASIVAGTANNVLDSEDEDGARLVELDILYAPDFVINAGGLINVAHEIKGYDQAMVILDIEKIYDRLIEIFTIAKEEGIPNHLAAKLYAKKRIERARQLNASYETSSIYLNR